MRNKPTRTTAYFYLLINVITWGAALPIVKLGLPYTTPFRYLMYRYILAIVLSLPLLMYFLPRIKQMGKAIRVITALELIGTTLALSFLYIGLSTTSALETSLIAITTPIFITLGGIVFLKEKQERHEWVGLFLALFGTLFLVLLPYFVGTNIRGVGSLTGNAFIVLQNIATAAYFILAKKHYRKLPKLFVTTISFYVGAITFGVLSLLEVKGNIHAFKSIVATELHSPYVWLIALYMALFGSIIGLTAYIKGQDSMEVSEASLFSYLQPLVFIPLSMVLLGESLSTLQILCLAAVTLGVCIAERRR